MLGFRIPKQEIYTSCKQLRCLTARLRKRDLTTKIICAEDLIQEYTDPMDILIADLHKNGTRWRKQVSPDS